MISWGLYFFFFFYSGQERERDYEPDTLMAAPAEGQGREADGNWKWWKLVNQISTLNKRSTSLVHSFLSYSSSFHLTSIWTRETVQSQSIYLRVLLWIIQRLTWQVHRVSVLPSVECHQEWQIVSSTSQFAFESRCSSSWLRGRSPLTSSYSSSTLTCFKGNHKVHLSLEYFSKPPTGTLPFPPPPSHKLQNETICLSFNPLTLLLPRNSVVSPEGRRLFDLVAGVPGTLVATPQGTRSQPHLHRHCMALDEQHLFLLLLLFHCGWELHTRASCVSAIIQYHQLKCPNHLSVSQLIFMAWNSATHLGPSIAFWLIASRVTGRNRNRQTPHWRCCSHVAGRRLGGRERSGRSHAINPGQ